MMILAIPILAYKKINNLKGFKINKQNLNKKRRLLPAYIIEICFIKRIYSITVLLRLIVFQDASAGRTIHPVCWVDWSSAYKDDQCQYRYQR